jgi:hypothetical protein
VVSTVATFPLLVLHVGVPVRSLPVPLLRSDAVNCALAPIEILTGLGVTVRIRSAVESTPPGVVEPLLPEKPTVPVSHATTRRAARMTRIREGISI